MKNEVRSQRLLQLLNIAGNPNLASFVKFSVVLKELVAFMDLDAEKFINDEREAFRQAQIIREAGGMQPQQQQPQGMSPMDMSGGGGGNIGVGGAAKNYMNKALVPQNNNQNNNRGCASAVSQYIRRSTVTPEVAKKLLPFVNTKKNTDALELYMEERVKDAQKTLEQSTDIVTIHMAQGAIRELRRPASLRSEVISKAENGT